MQRYTIDFGATAEPMHMEAGPALPSGWYVLVRAQFGDSTRTMLYGPMVNEEQARDSAPKLEKEEVLRMETVVRNFFAGWYK